MAVYLTALLSAPHLRRRYIKPLSAANGFAVLSAVKPPQRRLYRLIRSRIMVPK